MRGNGLDIGGNSRSGRRIVTGNRQDDRLLLGLLMYHSQDERQMMNLGVLMCIGKTEN
jgi:hypothetical protein